MSEQHPTAGWADQERIRRWIAGAQQREGQLAPISDELFQAAELQPGERVLDVGCGTGPTTFRAAELVAPDGRVVGLDVAPPMIEVARASAADRPDESQPEWLLGDAQTYDFGEGSFDVVLSRFGVMFFADPTTAFANLHRATRPGGRLTMAVWQTRDKVPLFDIPYRTAAKVLDGLGLSYEPVTIDGNQCSLGTHERVASVLEPAGWADVESHPTQQTLHLGGGLGLVDAAREALDVGPIRELLDGRPDDVREQVRVKLEEAFASHVDDTGVGFPGGFMIVTARRRT